MQFPMFSSSWYSAAASGIPVVESSRVPEGTHLLPWTSQDYWHAWGVTRQAVRPAASFAQTGRACIEEVSVPMLKEAMSDLLQKLRTNLTTVTEQ